MQTAFVLSGEGAKAAFQAGTIKWLDDYGIRPDYICGASSGALTSAFYSHVGIEGLLDLWRNVTGIGDVFNFQWNFASQMGFFGHKPALAKLTKAVMENDQRIPATVNRINLVTNEFQHIHSDKVSKQEFIEGALSSISIPVLIEPFDGQWVDGGARELAPLKEAIKRGAQDIYVLLATPPKYRQNPPFNGLFQVMKHPMFRLAEIGNYAVEFLLLQNLMNDLKLCLERNQNPNYRKVNIRIFGPKGGLGSPLAFNVASTWVTQGQNETVEYDPKVILDT